MSISPCSFTDRKFRIVTEDIAVETNFRPKRRQPHYIDMTCQTFLTACMVSRSGFKFAQNWFYTMP
jgi:hypothetical protein